LSVDWAAVALSTGNVLGGLLAVSAQQSILVADTLA